MADSFTEALTAALQKRADDTDLPRMPRRAAGNHPFQPELSRSERKTQRPYRDPTGQEAVGNLTPKKKRESR